MAELAERGIVLEVCPTSNVATGVYPSYEDHPLRALHEAGVKLTLGSDDPPYFGCSIGGEYAVARERFGFEEGELRAITRTAVEASFADDAVKSALLNRIDCLGRPREPIGCAPQVASYVEKEFRPVRRPLHFIACSSWSLRRSSPRAAARDDDDSSSQRLERGSDRDAGGQEDQGRPGHRHRRSQRPLVQPARQRGPRAGQVGARRRGPRADLEVQRGLRAEPLDAGAAEVRPRDRRRLPDGRRDGHRRHEVPGHEVRDHRRRRRRA